MSQQPHSRTSGEVFLLGQGEAPEWEKAAEQCLQQIGYVPPEANLGFLYVTDAFAGILPFVLDHLRDETGIAHWVGTVGMGICATAKEYYETSAMAAMVTSLPPGDFQVVADLRSSGDADDSLGAWLKHHAPRLAVVHGDPRNGATPGLIDSIGTRIHDLYLVGGLTSSRGDHPQIADSVVGAAVSGVLLSDQVPVVTGLSQGCTPIAGKRVITSCERNIIATIDDRPALDVFYEDIGEILARDLNRAAGYIFAGLPISGSDTGDYLVRNLVGVDTRNKLLAIGDTVEPGQALQFCRRDGTTAWEDMDRMLTDLKRRVGRRRIRGGLYYSCLGRGQNLFGSDSEELRAIRNELGDFPLVGFFANGEIFHNRLYGYTGVLTLFL